MTQPYHLLSVDVEDWPQSTLDHHLPISTRVVANTHRLLELAVELDLHRQPAAYGPEPKGGTSCWRS
jgi:hypothetical protein